MKKFSLLFSLVLLISCDSDDKGDGSLQNTAIYFPLTIGNTWEYKNENDMGTTEDSMFIVGTEESNGKTYTNLDATQPSNGLMVSVMAANLVRTTNGQFIINGALGAPVEGFPEISIPLDDVVLFDVNAAENSALSSLTGTLTEDILLDSGESLPLIINYISTTVQDAILDSYTVGTVTYTDVIAASIVLNLEVFAAIDFSGITINIPLLVPQDALVIKNYFAANTGLVFSEVTVDYELSDLAASGLELPIPTQSTQISTSVLTSFTIN